MTGEGADARMTFRDIKATVLNRVRQKTWPPGTLLPGEIELAEEFGCARATVNRAMRELQSEGIIERRRKAGTRVKSAPLRKAEFVIPLISEEIEATGAAYRYELIGREVVVAPEWLKDRIGLERGARALHLKCLHFADATPYQFEDRWINLAAVPQAEDHNFADIGPNPWLVQQVPFTEGELRFFAAAAPGDVAELMHIAPGAPVFVIERTTHLADQGVTFARLHFPEGYRMTSPF